VCVLILCPALLCSEILHFVFLQKQKEKESEDVKKKRAATIAAIRKKERSLDWGADDGIDDGRCLSTSVSLFLFLSIPLYLSTSVSVCLYFSIPLYLSTSISPYLYLSTSISPYLSISLPLFLHTSISLYLSRCYLSPSMPREILPCEILSRVQR
jgi:hypothetical protein